MSNNYQCVKKIRDSIIKNLRNAFLNDSKYTYDENSANTKIMINDVTPMEALKVPSIIVENVGVTESRYLQNDFFFEDETGYTRGSSLISRTSIQVLTLDTIKRDEIIDRIYQLLKDFEEILSENGIAIIKTDILPERRQYIQDRFFYTGGVTLNCYSEWVEPVTVDNISAINITITVGV